MGQLSAVKDFRSPSVLVTIESISRYTVPDSFHSAADLGKKYCREQMLFHTLLA